MGARRHESRQFPGHAILNTLGNKHRRDQRQIGQMSAAEIGVVEGDQIAGRERIEPLDGGLHGGGHRAQMDGDVFGLRQ